jgi:hypothetical protein
MKQKLTAAILSESVLEPYPAYRMAIGVLGVTLPPLLVIAFSAKEVQTSISAYYHVGGRDWFVGILWVIGVFLFFYQYKPQQQGQPKSRRPSIRSGSADAWLGRLAGFAAVLVALLPTTPTQGASQPAVIGYAHGAAALALFAALSLFPLLLFSQSQSKPKVRLYKWCGWLMLLFLGLIAAHQAAPKALREFLNPWKPVLVLEWLLIWAFGLSWFAKGFEPPGNALSGRYPRAS